MIKWREKQRIASQNNRKRILRFVRNYQFCNLGTYYDCSSSVKNFLLFSVN